LDYSHDAFTEDEVPDPYYGGEDGFEHVYQLVLSASRGLLAHIKEAHAL
jgi:protein-tyrosine phosphatase